MLVWQLQRWASLEAAHDKYNAVHKLIERHGGTQKIVPIGMAMKNSEKLTNGHVRKIEGDRASPTRHPQTKSKAFHTSWEFFLSVSDGDYLSCIAPATCPSFAQKA